MDYFFSTFSIFFLFFSLVCGAPAALMQKACAEVQKSSQNLNSQVREAAEQASNQIDQANMSNYVAWIEATDMCDPDNLKTEAKPCVEKILSILTSYKSAVDEILGFDSCHKFAENVKPALDKLENDIIKCVGSIGSTEPNKKPPSKVWEQPYVCRYTLDRLFSFSILTSRVFAVGDPAYHTHSDSKCK